MAKFYVGQRVRIIACDDEPGEPGHSLVGKEAVVNELDVENIDDLPGHVGLTVDGDPDWAFWPWEIEPIVPPHEACDDAEFIASLEKLAQRVGEVA